MRPPPQVYKGLDQLSGTVVAIKEISLEGLSASDLDGLQSEIDLLRGLNHRNVVQYLGTVKARRRRSPALPRRPTSPLSPPAVARSDARWVAQTKSFLYIILEYVENGSLSAIIKPAKFGAFPESLVAVYITQVLEGLAYLHEQGVIHRDIKGANILTTKARGVTRLEQSSCIGI